MSRSSDTDSSSERRTFAAVERRFWDAYDLWVHATRVLLGVFDELGLDDPERCARLTREAIQLQR